MSEPSDPLAEVTSIAVGVSMKRTRRNPETDGYETYEAHETWNFNIESGLDKRAKEISNFYTPKLISRVAFALHAMGGLTSKDIVEMTAKTKKLYNQEKKDATGPTDSNLSGTTDNVSRPGSSSAIGTTISVGENVRVSEEAGPGVGSPGRSESGLVSSETCDSYPENAGIDLTRYEPGR